MNTHAAPRLPLSAGPPITAVFPSPDSDTLAPNWPAPVSPAPVSFGPCSVHTPFERVKTQTAPTLPLSPGPPISARFPSPESATLEPSSPLPFSPDPE